MAPFLDYADDLEVRDAFGWTPLMTAVNRGIQKNASMLLSHGAKVDCDDMKGMSLVADAMNYADIGLFLSRCKTEDIEYQLFYFCLELIELLVQNGAQLAATPDMMLENDDKHPIHLLNYAVDDGMVDISKYLIEKGNVPLNVLDYTGWGPLHLAAGHNNIELVNLLLEKGADINLKVSL